MGNTETKTTDQKNTDIRQDKPLRRKRKIRLAVKSMIAMVVMLIVFTVVMGYIGYKGISDALLDHYSAGAFETADKAAALVDADEIDRMFAEGPDTEEYRELHAKVQALCNDSRVTFIYVIQPDLTDYAHIRFFISTASDDSGFEPYEFGYLRETTNDEYKVKYDNLYRGVTDRELLIRVKGFIETDPHITAMIPLTGRDGSTKAILCIQRQMEDIYTVRNKYLEQVAVMLVLLGLLIAFMQGLFVNKVMIEPLEKISNEALRFAKDNTRSTRKLADIVRNNDEIGDLAESIDEMELQVENYIDNLTTVTAEKERIGTELSLATRIQESMLPSVFPAFPDRDEFDIYAMMKAAKGVGGDFYDFFLTDDDHLVLVMADVSGKGIPAALFMMASMIAIRNQVHSEVGPAEVLARVNESICASNKEEMFVTVWLGMLEISTGKLTAANAGHEYPIIKNGDGDFGLYKDTHGFVVGAMEDVSYREYTIQLEHGAKLFVYTDGLPEAQDVNEEFFGTDRAVEVLNAHMNESPEDELKAVREAVREFTEGAEQFDDLTMLCLEYK